MYLMSSSSKTWNHVSDNLSYELDKFHFTPPPSKYSIDTIKINTEQHRGRLLKDAGEKKKKLEIGMNSFLI